MRDDDQPFRAGQKLTADQAREIRDRYNAGQVTMAQLAAEYGVSKMAVSYIVRRVIWDRYNARHDQAH